MASFNLLLFILITGITSEYVLVLGRELSQQVDDNITFIHTSCAATLYPNLCLTSLESYANKIHCNTTELALVAMTINLDLALSTSGWLSNLTTGLSSKTGREHVGMKDCVENVKTSVYNLKRSIEELVHPNGLNQGFVVGDLQTWVSAALTDERTCLDGFAGKIMVGELKNMISANITKLTELSSIALSFINKISSSTK